MKWLTKVIRSFIGRDRYHDQAAEVNNRGLRADLMKVKAEKARRAVLRVETESFRSKR